MPIDRRLRTGLAGGAAAVTLIATLAGCGATSSASPTSAAASSASAVPTAPVLAAVGDLTIAAGYVPAPASDDVAAAYFTVINHGGSADTLISASSDASATTSMHRTEGGSMVPVARFEIPANGSAAFTPGADHLMLENPTRALTKGGRVTLTLDFQDAGTVHVTLPITGYPTGGGLPSEALTPLPSTTAAQ